MKILKQMKGLGHIPLKVPNVKFDYDVTDIEVINVENLTSNKLGVYWLG